MPAVLTVNGVMTKVLELERRLNNGETAPVAPSSGDSSSVDLSGIQSQLNELNEKCNNCCAPTVDLSSIQSQIDELKVNSANQNSSKYDNLFTELQGNLSDCVKSINSLTERVNALETKSSSS